jgi:AcrR family transcriptional regulator
MLRSALITSKRPNPSRTKRGQRSRNAILSAAVGQLAEDGYRGASLASIAAAVNMTQQGLLHHFPSKERLLLALLEEKYHEDGRRLESSLDQEGLGMLRALQSLVEHNQSQPEMVRLFSALVAESLSARHPAHDYFLQRYAKIRARMLRSLREGQAAGTVRADADLERLVPVIVAVMDGLQTQWLLDPDVDMLSSFALFASLLTSQLTAQREEARTR